MTRISPTFAEGSSFSTPTFPEGNYVCEITACPVSMITREGEFKGEQEMTVKFRIASGPYEGQVGEGSIVMTGTYISKKDGSIMARGYVAKQIITAMVPTWKNGEEVDTADFVGRLAEFYLVPRLYNGKRGRYVNILSCKPYIAQNTAPDLASSIHSLNDVPF